MENVQNPLAPQPEPPAAEEAEESIDIESLMQLLKEKAKELKSTQKKLKKVEDKFVEMHKAQKNLVNDREVFIQFLHLVFPQNLLEDEIMLMPEGAEGYGQFDYNHLRQFYNLTTQTKDSEHLAQLEAHQEHKKILTQKIVDFEQLQAGDNDNSKKLYELQQENSNLQDKLSHFESQELNAKALDEQKETSLKMERTFLAQIDEIEKKLRAVSAENSEIKAKQLMNTFQNQGLQGSVMNSSAESEQKRKDEIQKLYSQISSQTNQILQLQDDKEELIIKLEDIQNENQNRDEDDRLQEKESIDMSKSMFSAGDKTVMDNDQRESLLQQIDQLNQTLQDKDQELRKTENHNKELEQKLQKLLVEFTQVRTKAQEMLVKKDQEIKKLKNVQNKKGDQGTQETQNADQNDYDSDSSDEEKSSQSKKLSQFQSVDQTSRAYIKNVLMKYLEYQANGLEKEAMMMEKVLFTVLKVQENEVKVLQDARVQLYNTGIMSYIWAPEETKIVAHPVKPRAYNPGR